MPPVHCKHCGKVLQEAQETSLAVTCPECVSKLIGLPRCRVCGVPAVKLSVTECCDQCALLGPLAWGIPPHDQDAPPIA